MGRMIVRSFSLTKEIVTELDKIPKSNRSEWMRSLLTEVLLEGKKPVDAPSVTPEMVKQMIADQLARMDVTLKEEGGEAPAGGEFDVTAELDAILKLGF